MRKIYILITFLGLAINQFNLNASADLNSGSTQEQINDLLIRSVKNGSLIEVLLSLQAGADVNAAIGNDEWTALTLAAASGSEEMVELLLQEGAGVNVAIRDGWTALMYAARRPEFEEIVELLLKARADVNVATDNDGWTALMFAASSGHKETVELLLKAGANINAVNDDGETVIDLAYSSKIKRFLMRYKALKFVKIDQKFDKEPKPEDYITDKTIPVGTSGENILSMLGQDDEAYGEQIEAFTKAHADYLRSKLQEAYKPFLHENYSRPLIKFFEEVQFGQFSEVATFFNSREDFLYVLRKLESDATGQVSSRLQKMIDLEEHIEKDIAARNR